MFRIVKPIVRAATSSGLSSLFANGSTGVMSEDGYPLKMSFGSSGVSSGDTSENGTTWILLLLVFGRFTLLLLSVMLLCLISTTCLCWLLLTPIQLGYELLINVVSPVTVHLDFHDFCESLFRCFMEYSYS